MMKIFRIAIALSTLIVCNPVLAQTLSETIEVRKAYARAVIPGMGMSGAYLMLINPTDTEHFLQGASSSAARHVELHMHVQQNGMMRMRQAEHFHLKPGTPTVLEPGGKHIMLIGLKQQLKQGDTIDLKLEFSDGSSKELTLPVKAIGSVH